MSFHLYDKALLSKIGELFPNVINCEDESALKESTNNDPSTQEDSSNKSTPKVTLPLISFWRTESTPALSGSSEGNFVQMIKGRNVPVSDVNGFHLRTFPVTLSYQVSIWSQKRVEVDEIYKEFLMLFFIDEPYLKVTAVKGDFYDDVIEGDTEIVVEEEFALKLEDASYNTDIASFSDKGRVYRQDIMITIDNAKLFYLGNKSKINKIIPVTVELIEQ